MDSYEESPPVPFPQRFPEHSRNSFHGDRFAVSAMNDGSDRPSVTGDGGGDGGGARSCVVLVITFFTFAMTLTFGVYASETMRLGPNASILIKPNRLLVKSVKVVELDVSKGTMLYGFYESPPLDVSVTWSEPHQVTLPASTHKDWIYYLNEGSQINISYSVNSLRRLVLVIAQGKEDFAEWLQDPSYPRATLSWNAIHGNGTILNDVPKSSLYYIAVGNLNSEDVEVHLNIGIEASLYNTTEAYNNCTPARGQCTFQLHFLSENAAVLTSPSGKSGMIGGDWHVELSYGPRWNTYLIGIGGTTVLVLLINYILNRFRRTEQDVRRDQPEAGGPERRALLSDKDDNVSSQGSSYASLSGEEHVEDTQAGGSLDSQHLCAICFDAPKDSFFLPCGHCVACFGCATRIAEASGTCPVCRRRTKKVRKIYTV